MNGILESESFDYYNYEDPLNDTVKYEEKVLTSHDPVPLQDMILLVLNATIFLLGIFGNGVVIWISGFKMKKSVNSTWYLSLAVSDFIYCCCLPFTIVQLATSDWPFGLPMCKINTFVMFLNMFSSILILVIISVDRCVTVVFPVWSQNKRTVRVALVVVIIAWAISFFLSVPSLIYRDIMSLKKTVCYNNYKGKEHQVIAVTRFIFGFVMPFLTIVACYIIIIHKLRRNRMTKSSKPFKVMSAIIVTFFICWLPYHIIILLELEHRKYVHDLFKVGAPVSVLVASANSFLNPILYAFMGKDFKKLYRNCVLSKIANALSDDGVSSSKRQSLTEHSKVSTHV